MFKFSDLRKLVCFLNSYHAENIIKTNNKCNEYDDNDDDNNNNSTQ